MRHVSALEGDGAGYDVEPYTKEGEKKYVEVKTTRGPAGTAFYMSAKEVEFSRRRRDDYHLYRVYDYDEARNSGRFFVVSGSVEESFGLTPTQYRIVRS